MHKYLHNKSLPWSDGQKTSEVCEQVYGKQHVYLFAFEFLLLFLIVPTISAANLMPMKTNVSISQVAADFAKRKNFSLEMNEKNQSCVKVRKSAEKRERSRKKRTPKLVKVNIPQKKKP